MCVCVSVKSERASESIGTGAKFIVVSFLTIFRTCAHFWSSNDIFDSLNVCACVCVYMCVCVYVCVYVLCVYKEGKERDKAMERRDVISIAGTATT